MIHTIKRYAALFVLVCLAGAVPVFAASAKSNSSKKNETKVVDIQGKKPVPMISKIIGRKDNHKYQLNLQAGEKAVFRLRSDKPVSLKIQTADGVRVVESNKYFEGALSVAGDYVIEVSSQEISLYTLEISGN